VAAYNKGMSKVFARIRDFLILHYCRTERRDSQLWRDVTAMELPDTLAFRLHAWRQTGALNMYAAEGFESASWLAIHSGLGHWPERLDPVLDEVPLEEAREALRQRREQIAAMVAAMPTHDAYLRSVVRR
jgi:tryptophan halogenase